MPAGRMPQPGDLIARKYQIERLLGKGGMGAVFEARHTIIQKSVALKWLRPDLSTDPEFMHRLIREARAAGRVHHPHVLAVHDVGEHDGALFLVMDYLRGMSLETLLASGPLPWPEALSLLIPAMRGVHAAHQRGVLHRDLKPANIFLCEDDQGNSLGPKVLDFGISKIVDARYEDGASTETGAQLGTPAYMSPEQLRGEKLTDERIDVYAFGVILYRMLAGRLPFTGATSSALAINAATTEAPALASLCPELPSSLVGAVEMAMARDRSRRFANVEALIAALEQLDSGARAGPGNAVVSAVRSLHTTTSGTASVATARTTRVPWLAWGALGAIVGSALMYFAATRSTKESTVISTSSGTAILPTSSAAVEVPEKNAVPSGVMPGASNAPEALVVAPVVTPRPKESPSVRPHERAPGRPRGASHTSPVTAIAQTPRPVPSSTSTSPASHAPADPLHLKTDDF